MPLGAEIRHQLYQVTLLVLAIMKTIYLSLILVVLEYFYNATYFYTDPECFTLAVLFPRS